MRPIDLSAPELESPPRWRRREVAAQDRAPICRLDARRDSAIPQHAPADTTLSRTPAPPRHRGAARAQPGRFSPLNAPQRSFVDAFLSEARPWALRQARRSYGHLPAELHERAVDQAFVALRTGAPARLDRRALYASLADALTGSLRQIHSGWCLNQSDDVWARDTAHPPMPARHPIAAFVDAGLAGLERAVLQLEIGAGRDTATARAALRLSPRAYRRHRDEGLGKLRGAVAGLLRGRVCEDHLDAVTLAATGDRGAAAQLGAGPTRCRSCAREAGTVRRVLHERLALAPWPLLIKPAGMVAAKAGALGAIFAGKGSAGIGTLAGGALTAGTAKGLAAVVAAAVVASGSVAAVGPDAPASPEPAVQRHDESAPARTLARHAAPAQERHEAKRRRSTARRRPAEHRSAWRGSRAPQAPATTTTPTASSPPAAVVTPPRPVTETVRGVENTVDELVKTVEETVGLPPVEVDTDAALPDVRDRVTGTVEGLLGP